MKFQNNSEMFSDRQKEQLELKVEEMEREHPNQNMEYKLIYRLVKLIGALLIKWNLVDTKGYKYRFKERQRVIRHYNLQYFSDLIPIETIWLSTVSEHSCIAKLFSPWLKKKAIKLRVLLQSIIDILVLFNRKADFQRF